MKPLTVEEVLYLHYRLMAREGGQHGVRIPDFLASALARPFMQVRERDVYPTAFDKAGVLMYSLAAAKCFREGNELTAVAAALMLLDRSGFKVENVAGLAALAFKATGLGWRDFSAWFQRNCVSK